MLVNAKLMWLSWKNEKWKCILMYPFKWMHSFSISMVECVCSICFKLLTLEKYKHALFCITSILIYKQNIWGLGLFGFFCWFLFAFCLLRCLYKLDSQKRSVRYFYSTSLDLDYNKCKTSKPYTQKFSLEFKGEQEEVGLLLHISGVSERREMVSESSEISVLILYWYHTQTHLQAIQYPYSTLQSYLSACQMFC